MVEALVAVVQEPARETVTIPRLILIALAVSVPGTPALAGRVDFDSIAATGSFGDVVPGGPRGPLLVFPGITLDGGVVINSSLGGGGIGDLATTAPNMYATSGDPFFVEGLHLPGYITGTFTTPATYIELDIIRGYETGIFTLTAYSGATWLAETSVLLGCIDDFECAAPARRVSLSALGITSFTVGGGGSPTVFAIDTVSFTANPEPGSLLLLGIGLAGLAAFSRRLRQR